MHIPVAILAQRRAVDWCAWWLSLAHWAVPTPCVGDRDVCVAHCVPDWGNDVYIVTSLPGCWEPDGLFILRSESDIRCIHASQREFNYAPTASGGADLAASVVDNDYGNPTGTPLERHGKGSFQFLELSILKF